MEGGAGKKNGHTGSQPSIAENPLVPHPSPLPEVMSVRADAALEYSHGLRNPSTGFPAAMSWSLTSEMTLANVGLAQLVPDSDTVSPSNTTSKETP